MAIRGALTLFAGLAACALLLAAPALADPPSTPEQRAAWQQDAERRAAHIQSEIQAGRGAQVVAEADALAREVEARLPPQQAVVFAHFLALQAAAQAQDAPKYALHLRAVVRIWRASSVPPEQLLLDLCLALAGLGERERDMQAQADAYAAAAEVAMAIKAPRAEQIRLLELAFEFGLAVRLDMVWAKRQLDLRSILVTTTLPVRWAWKARQFRDEAAHAYGLGDFAAAQKAIDQAIVWCGRAKPADANPLVAAGVWGMAGRVGRARGQLDEAEAAARQAVDLAAQVTNDGGWELDRQTGSLAKVLQDSGRCAEAVALVDGRWQQVATTAASKRDHSLLAMQRATTRSLCRDHTGALAAYGEAIAILREFVPADSPTLAMAELATVDELSALRRWQEAEAVFQRSGAQFAKVLPADHSDAVLMAAKRSHVLRNLGQPQAALTTLQQAWRQCERNPQGTARARDDVLIGLAMTELDLGRPKQALEWLRQHGDLAENELARELRWGTEAQRRELLNRRLFDVVTRIALALQELPGDPQAAALAADAQLRRKGRALDAMAERHGLPQQQSGELAALRQRVDLVRDQLAQSFGGDREAAAELQRQLDALERQWTARTASLGAGPAAPGLAQVQAALPADSVLIEYAVWGQWEAAADGKGPRIHENFGQDRLAALILVAKEPPTWVDLGPLVPIEKLAGQWHAALADPQRSDVDVLGRQLDAAVLAPLRKLLPPRARLVLSPVGALYRVPFAALVDERGRYLLETRELAVLPAGRDLVAALRSQGAPGPALVLANPAFNGAPEAGPGAAGRRSVDAERLRFAPLPGAEAEGRAVAAAWPGAVLLQGTAASEAAVKAADNPQVLHLATHGFWLPARNDRIENPLLRSGVALSGSNQRRAAGEDGLLTALEAGQLNLGATRLVVLSACETGLGELRGILDGVEGLQRAILAAGATAVVSALWQVDDDATRALMVDFYRRLQAGAGRGEALAAAQKASAALKNQASSKTARGAEVLGTDNPTAPQPPVRRWRHPYYWAAFQLAGNWLKL